MQHNEGWADTGDTHQLWAVHLHTHTLTLTGQTRLIYVSHAGHNLTVFRPTVEAINADVCFCIDIPELTSCFPQTQNATAMCVCAVVSHATPFASRPPATFKSINARTFFRTYVRQFVSSSRRMQTEKHMVAMLCAGLRRGGVAASCSSLRLYNMHWNVTHNCKLSAPTSASCISCESESNISCLHTSWHVPNGGKNKNKKDAHDIYKLLICHVFLVILKTED